MSLDIRLKSITLLGLIGLFMSVYLLLYTLGFYGRLMCGTGHCEVVQASEYARFLTLPVPAWGTAWYLGVFGAAVLMIQRGLDEWDLLGRFLALLATGGLLFSAYLTAIEAFVLHVFCRWCLVSAALAVLIFLLAAPWKQLQRAE